MDQRDVLATRVHWQRNDDGERMAETLRFKVAMRWTRTNKTLLASQISSLMAEKLSYRQIAERVGKSKTRVWQIVQLFSLHDRTLVR